MTLDDSYSEGLLGTTRGVIGLVAKAMANDDSRETADWARQASDAGPKMAALLAAGQVADPTGPMVTLNSEGVTLVYGRDEQALEAAALLKDQLDVTVMIAATSNFSGGALAASASAMATSPP